MKTVWRLLLVALTTLIVAWVAYFGSCLIALKNLADAARSNDGAAVLARTDLPSLRRSLAIQILGAYDRRSGEKRRPSIVAQLLKNAGPTIADQIVAQIITPERLSEFLRSGRLPTTAREQAPQLPSLTSLRVSEAVGRVRFVNFVTNKFRTSDDPDSSYLVVMHFESFSWKLAGIELPEPVLAKIVEQLR